MKTWIDLIYVGMPIGFGLVVGGAIALSFLKGCGSAANLVVALILKGRARK